MVRYLKRLILKYINGEDIEGIDIEELEDNYSFMIDVIDYTNDKNMYEMCSSRVQNTYEFVLFMINKFSNDIDFICEIVDEYLDNEREEAKRIEILIMIYNLVDKDSDYYLIYNAQLSAIYTAFKFNIDAIKGQPTMEYEAIRDFVQEGFYFVIEDYGSNDIVMKYFARRFANDIFNELNIGLEDRLHRDFRRYEDVEKIGISIYLLKILDLYDTNLSSYVSSHIDVLDDIKKEMVHIKNRWNDYNSSMEYRKYDNMISLVHEYMEKFSSECIFTEDEILYYLGRELGIADKIFKYDNITQELYGYIMGNLPNNIYRCNNILYLNSKRHYDNIKSLMIRALSFGSDDVNMVISRDNDIGLKVNTRLLKFRPKVENNSDT